MRKLEKLLKEDKVEKIPIYVRLPSDLHKEFKGIAKKKGVSLNKLFIAAVKLVIEMDDK